MVSVSGGVIRILLIEDNEADARLVTRAIQRAGLVAEIARVEDGDALRSALFASRWDLVISDWALPGFGALEALAIVQDAHRDLPFIIVSGTVGEERAADAMRAGAADYVLKDNLARLGPAIERELRDYARRLAHRRQEARFRAMIEKSAEAVVLNSFDGTILYASPASLAIVGRRAEELVGTHCLALAHPADRPIVAATMMKVRAGRSSESAEVRMVRPDGAERWVAFTATNLLDDPDVHAVVVNIRDVSERRRSADALRASEARFASLAASGIIGILTANVEGRVLDANDAYLEMIGYSREDIAAGAVSWPALIAPELAAATEQVAATFHADGFIRPWETTVIRKDGERVPMLVGVAMVEFPICVAFCADLRERKRAEEALRTTEDHLRHAQKMEAVGRLAGGVAHDFNNVLSVVLSYAEMLLADLEPDDHRRDDLTEIFNAGKRAADLTRQLLMFSRQQVVEPRILDLNQVTANMDKMLRRVLGEDIELVAHAASDLGTIHADPSSIEQVIMNLVVNARDAMPTGGRLTIATANVVLDESPPDRPGGLAPGPYILLAVTDTGTGMDRGTQARIFEPFFTTKEKEKGTGLGLSTVFGILQQAGGAIVVASELGQGATFSAYLPRIDGTVETTQPLPFVIQSGMETILLVEDDAQVRAVARGILRRHGYTVIEAATPQAGFTLCAEHAGEIHMLLTDVVMPQMSGPELAKRLRSVRPEMLVLCMSGYTDDSIVRHGISSSEIPFLQKPFTPESLARKVREVLDAAAREREI